MSTREARLRRGPRSGLPLHLWAAIGVFAASLLVQQHVRTEAIHLGYALEQERRIGEELRSEHAYLAIEATSFASDERLAELARERGMRLATKADIESLPIRRGSQ